LTAIILGLERQMRRREFITLLGGAAAATGPLPLGAQPTAQMRRVGVLYGGSAADPQGQSGLARFKQALQELGWTPGRNLAVEYRWADGDAERMPPLAKELVALQPDLIVGHTTPVTAALQQATSTIPLVFVIVSDPVGSGFVASLPRPGGNITGFINFEASLGGKWVELLKEANPSVTRAAFLFNPDTAPYWEYYVRPFESAARSLSVEPIAAPLSSAADIERAIASLVEAPNGGLVVMPDIFTGLQSTVQLIVSLADRHHLAAIYPYRYMAVAGGLMSYGVDNADLWRRSASYVDRILKGAKPAELPVQLPTKFELVINLKTAKTVGLEIPWFIQQRADEVIE